MATITGTTSADSLIGTAADDILRPYGVGLNGPANFMSGGDGAGSITIKNQFAGNDSEIEELQFNAGYWTGLRFKILDAATTNIGDDRRYDDGTGGELNEGLFGTDGDDLVLGNSGTNFVWLGAGADTLIYKEADRQILNGQPDHHRQCHRRCGGKLGQQQHRNIRHFHRIARRKRGADHRGSLYPLDQSPRFPAMACPLSD